MMDTRMLMVGYRPGATDLITLNGVVVEQGLGNGKKIVRAKRAKLVANTQLPCLT